ncbi:MAG: hypothetical protein IJS03_05990 [Eubacterium sp.]|nr:hypothetical protein [Eubacterium sp.]
MREFRKKQKLIKKIMNILVIFTALYLLALIAIEPKLQEMLGNTTAYALHYGGEILVVAVMVLVLYYYSKYSKSDSFLTNVEYELSDCGYYLTERQSKSVDAYYDEVKGDLINNAFSISENEVINELEFDLKTYKRNEFFFIVKLDEVDKNDILAYLDSAVYDLTAVNMKRSGNAVLMFICDRADAGAIELSKTISTMGRKEHLKVAIVICEVSASRVYFLGNNETKCQQMIVKYAMNSTLPVKDELKGERLEFQDVLEEHMKDFDLDKFRQGEFFSH